MPRLRRHQRIAELLRAQPVRSQQELVDRLAADGMTVTQATLSRDLHEMGVWKGPRGYVLPEGANDRTTPWDPTADDPDAARLPLDRIVASAVIGASAGGTIVVLHTRPAHAHTVAIEIDRIRPHGVLGTVAGDDTVFVATSSARDARTILGYFNEMSGAPDAPAQPTPRRTRLERRR